jgi:chromosome segregation ATPase
MKEELTKCKERNEELEAQLAQTNGRETPSMMGDLDSLRKQLADLRDISEQSSAENEELQRQMHKLKAEYDQTLQQQESDTAGRIDALEGEIQQHEQDLEKTRRDLDETLALNRQLNEQLRAALKSPTSPRQGSGASPEHVQRLEQDLLSAENRVEWLKRENQVLEARCRESEGKISLLLDAWEGRGKRAR